MRKHIALLLAISLMGIFISCGSGKEPAADEPVPASAPEEPEISSHLIGETDSGVVGYPILSGHSI